jgi:RHS repeat-associated protein
VKAQLLTGGIDETFLRIEGTSRHSVLADGNNNTVRLLDANQTKVVDYTYEPYGRTTADATNGNTQQYTGRENDNPGNAGGLYYYRARYYMPGCARFISEDPIGWASGQTNNYGYVGGDPIGSIDPYGLYLCRANLPGMGNAILDDGFARLVGQWIQLNEQEGISLTFNEAFRTSKAQAAMRDNPNAITPASPGKSWHEAGRAVDAYMRRLDPYSRSRVIANAKALGMRWGGNFSDPDPPHFDYPSKNQPKAIGTAQREYYGEAPLIACP